MATPSVIPLDPNRDSSVRLHRQTREHRHLWYQLTVLQQPERARACGAGTKGMMNCFTTNLSFDWMLILVSSVQPTVIGDLLIRHLLSS